MAKAIVVAAPASGSGKTLITLGLLRALRNSGVRVAAAKVGPDYIDPRFHEAATGRPCYNLDPWAMSPNQIKGLVAELARDTDLVIIEGVMGLFDGPRGAKGSTADLAVMLGLPVLFALDCRHQAQSAAALVHGFASYRKDLDLAGVILNRTASERHELLLREALGHEVLLALRNDEALSWPSRHLGLVQAQENRALDAFIEAAALRVSNPRALERILDLAQPLHGSDGDQILPPLAPSIAIACDDAFSFSYSYLLDSWRRQGAPLSTFSPLADEAPDATAGAVFLPGGYPELHAGRIAANRQFLDGLRSHAGQVAFPGGKVDDTDENSIFAALREAEEELNIPPARVEVIGVGDTYYSGSGYSIAPVVGIIPPDLELQPNPQEVEDWFEVPLAFLLDPANSIKKEANWNGQQRSYYDMQWGERRIWGVTAGIIANLVRRLA